MRFPDIRDDLIEIVMHDPAEILILVDLSQLQRPHVQIVFSGVVLFHDRFPRLGQDDVHIMNPHCSDSIHTDLRVHHQALKNRMRGDLTQQAVIDPPACHQLHHIITQVQTGQVCVWVIFYFRDPQQVIRGHPIEL